MGVYSEHPDLELFQDSLRQYIGPFSLVTKIEKGRTAARKYVLQSNTGLYFFKVGEKTQEELHAYQNEFVRNCPLFVTPTNDYFRDPFLLRPYAHGEPLDKLFCNGAISPESVIALTEKVLTDTFNHFWSKGQISDPCDLGQWASARLQESLSPAHFRTGWFNHDCLSYKIVIECAAKHQRYTCPSIQEMSLFAIREISRFSGTNMMTIGDFHPGNIIFEQYTNPSMAIFHIIDIANIKRCDVALDLGIYINFFERLHCFTCSRDGYFNRSRLSCLQTPEVHLSDNTITIRTEFDIPQLPWIRGDLLRRSILRVMDPLLKDGDLEQKINLFGQVASIAAIRRNARLDKGTFGLLILAAINSFIRAGGETSSPD